MPEPRKYRKKPVVIEAMRLEAANQKDVCDWMQSNGERGQRHDMDGNVHIPTLEGTMLATHGDFIIRGVKGEFYPCKPDIFEATYEAVE